MPFYALLNICHASGDGKEKSPCIPTPGMLIFMSLYYACALSITGVNYPPKGRDFWFLFYAKPHA
jgi:hypothetical protein